MAAAPHLIPDTGHRLLVAAVGRRPEFLGAVGSALAGLTDQSDRVLHTGDGPASAPDDVGLPAYAEARRRARRYLDHVLPRADIHLLTAGSLAQAGARVAAEVGRHDGRQALALVLVDAASADVTVAPLARGIDDALATFHAHLPHTLHAEISPYTTFVYAPRCDDGIQVGRGYALRQAPDEPRVLASRRSVAPAADRDTATELVRDDSVDAILQILNHEKSTLLWQCGHLTPDETELVHDIARQAGVALADSLARPGSVAKYRHGRVVEEYLGSLGLYGYSARVYDYLHRDGRLKPRDEQCLFFLKSRIPEIATPFSQRVLARGLRIVQVTNDPHDRAPFADHAVVADLETFLRHVRERLDVRPEVLQMRRAAIRATRDSASDVVGELPLQPMSLNYFFRRLGSVLERLITTEGYTYTGVFDVGRGGLSAVRNLPRTGPGFSGWYGRALMGDALEAVPAIALTRPGNVLAFVGDGAAGLVPDILPMFVQQVCIGGAQLHGNLSIFRLIDGDHSLIRTYREARQGAVAGYQATLVGLVDEDWRRSFGPLDVTHRRLTDVNPAVLAAQLRAAGTVNLYSVILAHNNEGDGLSLLASLGWQRDQVPELAFAAGPAATHPRGSP